MRARARVRVRTLARARLSEGAAADDSAGERELHREPGAEPLAAADPGRRPLLQRQGSAEGGASGGRSLSADAGPELVQIVLDWLDLGLKESRVLRLDRVHRTISLARWLPLEGVSNCRDLGGWAPARRSWHLV